MLKAVGLLCYRGGPASAGSDALKQSTVRLIPYLKTKHDRDGPVFAVLRRVSILWILLWLVLQKVWEKELHASDRRYRTIVSAK